MSAGVLLHLMRHGEPALTGRMLGHTDCPVTPAGVAACLAQAEGLEATRIVSSDLTRASVCAEAIGRSWGVPPTTDARWREIDFGAWDGTAPAELDQAALGRFWNDPEACPPPGGERWSDLTTRIAEAIPALEPEPTLIVTHGGAMRAALALLCGFDQRRTWAFDLPYAAILTLRVWPGPPRSAQIVGLWP